MKRDFDQAVLDLDGKQFGAGETLKSMSFLVLTAPLEEDNKAPLDARMKLYGLIQKVHKGGVLDVTAEEIASIKTRAAKVLTILAVGALCELLEKEPKE